MTSAARRPLAAVAALVVLAASLAAVYAYAPLAWLDRSSGQEQVRWVFWQQIGAGQSIPVKIGEGGTPDIDIPPSNPAIDEFEAIELALHTWENVPGVPVQFDIQRSTTNDWGYDGQNVIFFADKGDVGYGAVTLITYDNVTGRILDADIHINDHNIRWLTSLNDANGEPLPCPCQGSDPNAVYTNDIQGIATHELGHFLGLEHSAVGVRESAAAPTMYPRGIWDVPGDDSRPPDSRYRSLEPDDIAGLQAVYPPVGWSSSTATIEGVVHDRQDRPLFGASVVARNLLTGKEIGVLSGMTRGVYRAANFVLAGLPPGVYELRATAVDGSPPGFVGWWNFGGIARALVDSKFPARMDLPTMYYELTYAAADATPVTLAAGDDVTIDFRPIAAAKSSSRLLRPARAFALAGVLNADVTGPLQSAALVYTVDGANPVSTPLPLAGGAYTVQVPLLPAGSVVDHHVEVHTVAGKSFASPTDRLQVGLSGQPLLFASKMGDGTLGAVDAGTMLEVDVTSDEFSFPLGQALHRGRNGLYVASFGDDTVSFVPFADEALPATTPRSFDQDGDGLNDALEPLFGLDPNNPDTDGDLALDGAELSEFVYTDPSAGASHFDVVGGTVANDHATPLGFPFVTIALWNVTDQQWATSSMPVTPTGRFRLRLPAGKTYNLAYFDSSTGAWVGGSPNWTGAAGQVLNGGVIAVGVAPPAERVADTGSDPLDPLDGGPAVFRPTAARIALPSGADPGALALGTTNERYLFASGTGTNTLYKIDTQTDQVVGTASAGADQPGGVAVTPDGAKVFVSESLASSVAVFDAETLERRSTIPLTGRPAALRVSRDGRTAIVTCDGASDLVLIDAASETVRGASSTGVGRLHFLSEPSYCTHRALATAFQVGQGQVWSVDVATGALAAIPLPGVDATSGVALSADGWRGWAIDYFTPQLVEIDLRTGAALRRTTFGYIDIRDVMVFPPADALSDADGDGVVNVCDVCPTVFDPAQADSNGDGQGDLCDAHDGVITLHAPATDAVAWDAEAGLAPWNLHRGDLDVLRGAGAYTQPAGSNPLALRVCGLPAPQYVDLDRPAPRKAAFYLVTGLQGGTESSLGKDSSGRERPNTDPCP